MLQYVAFISVPIAASLPSIPTPRVPCVSLWHQVSLQQGWAQVPASSPRPALGLSVGHGAVLSSLLPQQPPCLMLRLSPADAADVIISTRTSCFISTTSSTWWKTGMTAANVNISLGPNATNFSLHITLHFSDSPQMNNENLTKKRNYKIRPIVSFINTVNALNSLHRVFCYVLLWKYSDGMSQGKRRSERLI